VEIVIALAVVSFAIIAIMGLFPVAMKSAQESQRETRATQIARRIFDELQSLPGTNTAIVRGPSITNTSWRVPVNLSASGTYLLGFDEQGNGISDTLAAFDNPILDGGVFYVAKVQVTPNIPSSGLSQVQTTIEAPASTTTSNRTHVEFQTVLSQ